MKLILDNYTINISNPDECVEFDMVLTPEQYELLIEVSVLSNRNLTIEKISNMEEHLKSKKEWEDELIEINKEDL